MEDIPLCSKYYFKLMQKINRMVFVIQKVKASFMLIPFE